MARRGWLVLLCSLASCPPPPPPPECPPTASVELRVWLPLATGPQAVPTVTRADAGLVETTLRLVRSDGGLAAESGPTFAREFTWDFETPEADAYHLTYAATCDGRLLDEGRWLYSVYARLQLDRSLPRGCGRLTRLSPELLECDGVVVFPSEVARYMPQAGS